MQHHLTNWKLVTKDQWFWDTVKCYHINLVSEPFQFLSLICSVIADPTGSKGINKQGAVSEVLEPHNGFHSSLFLVLKEGGDQRLVINLIRVCSNITLQDGRNPYLERVSEAWRLACQSRSEFTQLTGCFSGSLPIVSHLSSMGLYQDPKTSFGPPTRIRSTYDCIHRRHTLEIEP